MFVQMYSLKARNFSSSGTSSSLSFGCGPKLPDQSHVRSLTYRVSWGFFKLRMYMIHHPLNQKNTSFFTNEKTHVGLGPKSPFFHSYLSCSHHWSIACPPQSTQPLVAISPGNSMLGNSVMSTKPADFRKSMRVGNDGFGGGKNMEIMGRNEEILGKVLRKALILIEWYLFRVKWKIKMWDVSLAPCCSQNFLEFIESGYTALSMKWCQ